MTSSPERSSRDDIPVVNISPLTDPKFLKTIAAGQRALVLIGFAGGSIPSRFSPIIKEITESGTQVFVLPDKEGNDHGTLRLTDEPHYEAKAAGLIYLEKANIKHTQEVGEAIQCFIDKGLTGGDLGEAVRLHFSYGHDEEKPIPEWEDPKRQEAYVERMKWKDEE